MITVQPHVISELGREMQTIFPTPKTITDINSQFKLQMWKCYSQSKSCTMSLNSLNHNRKSSCNAGILALQPPKQKGSSKLVNVNWR